MFFLLQLSTHNSYSIYLDLDLHYDERVHPELVPGGLSSRRTLFPGLLYLLYAFTPCSSLDRTPTPLTPIPTSVHTMRCAAFTSRSHWKLPHPPLLHIRLGKLVLSPQEWSLCPCCRDFSEPLWVKIYLYISSRDWTLAEIY